VHLGAAGSAGNMSGSAYGKADITGARQRQGWMRQLQTWENLEAPAPTLGAPQIIVEQSGKKNFYSWNPAGVAENHSYYLSFTDC